MKFKPSEFKMENVQNKEEMSLPKIEKKFTDGFPPDWRPWIDGWAFTPNELKELLPDGTYKLLVLDVAINQDEYVRKVNQGIAEELGQEKTARELTKAEKATLGERAMTYYNCEIGCKHCYSCKTELENPLMSKEDTFEVVKKAKELGLKSIKFLEPGELVHNEKLFEILDFCETNDIDIIIFTKGVIFGDDELARDKHQLSAQELANKIARYSHVKLVVGLTAFTKEIEEKRIESKITDFVDKRNKGLENLVNAGMNSDVKKPRLCLICAPILKDNIQEALAIYAYGLERNMPVILAPTMVSGKGEDMAEVRDEFFKQEQLVSLYRDVYIYLIDNKIFTLEQVEREGISPYAGIPCSQFIAGMFIRTDGRVQACPGNEGEAYRYAKDVRRAALKDIWKNSLGYRLRQELVESGKDMTTQICYAKTEGDLVQIGSGSIPKDFYEKVIKQLKEYYHRD